MPNGLVTSNQFNLQPNLLGAIGSGAQLAQGLGQIRQEQTQQALQPQVQALRGQLLGGDPASPGLTRDQAFAQLGSLSPEDLTNVQAQERERFSQQSAEGQEAIRSIVQGAAQVKAIPTVEGKLSFLSQRREQLISQGRQTQGTDQAISLYGQGRVDEGDQLINEVVGLGERVGLLKPLERDAKVLAKKPDVQSSEFLPGGGTRVVRKDGSVEVVQPTEEEIAIIKAGEQRGVDLQQQRAKGRGLGKGGAQIANKALDITEKLRSNNGRLRQVIELVGAGAETGPIAKKLPSFRASTLRLKALQNELGLDVVSAVTFGALSEKELEIAMDTGLPTSLQGPDLVKWAKDKISSQEKLAAHLEDQAIFLSKPGNTAADWLERGRTIKLQRDSELSPEEQAELDELRKRFGK